ncbi:MAG: amino acid permease [Schwartzia sp.]|nr:amino acid permease [Schwartzia sp. (in: firmicutes)]
MRLFDCLFRRCFAQPAVPGETPAENGNAADRLPRHLSALKAWALSLGCAVGWGAFVMPGSTFLPVAGPWGTTLGIVLGTLLMLVIARNYHYMIQRYPDTGGTFTYAKNVFGYDHAFIATWFFWLTYAAILWANAANVALLGRVFLGRAFQFGFHYRLWDYDIYGGEVFLEIAALAVFALLAIRARRFSFGLLTVMAVILCVGVAVLFCGVVAGSTVTDFSPAFAEGSSPYAQVLRIMAMAPWAFAGFEVVSHAAGEVTFPVRKSFPVMVAAVIASGFIYLLLSYVALLARPDGFSNWTQYLRATGGMDGVMALPVFYAVQEILGPAGLFILALTILAALTTSLIGLYFATSRVLYALAGDDLLPGWLMRRSPGTLNRDGVPAVAILIMLAISLPLPFIGRAALGWIVDVNTVGATLAYAYTSACAYALARSEGNRKMRWFGGIGTAVSLVLCFVLMMPNLWGIGSLATETYLILTAWSVLGFVFFRMVFEHDAANRLGKSTIAWLLLLFLIFFVSFAWLQQSNHDNIQQATKTISEFYNEEMVDSGVLRGPDRQEQEDAFLQAQMASVRTRLFRNSLARMTLILATLYIMFSIYSVISNREKKMEEEKRRAEEEKLLVEEERIHTEQEKLRAEQEKFEAEQARIEAEEGSRAKTVFLSNMSHDIRTPMNAIIGYTTLAQRQGTTPDEMRGFLTKIDAASQHLMALINDILEMSRIESGRMELEERRTDLKNVLAEVQDMFATQMKEKDIRFAVDTSRVENSRVLCDKNRLDRVLLNLISNAYKFTPKGGRVTVSLIQMPSFDPARGVYELRVKDSGIGMTPEFAQTVFEPFTREKTATVSGIQGTGLGMSITKSIIDLMNGSIDVETAPGKGTEFIIQVAFVLDTADETEAEAAATATPAEIDFSQIKLLLVDDLDVNREIAAMLLMGAGFEIETAVNGQDALDKVRAAHPGDYAAVLMDIQMPVMNGYEATKAIRRLSDPGLSCIPIIAMTANAFSEDVQNAKDAGMNAHIAKPLDVSKMIATLTEVLQASARKA